MVPTAHNFPLKWFPWQPKSYGMSTISVLSRMLTVVKIGLKLTELQSEVCLFINIISNCTWFYHKTPLSIASHRIRWPSSDSYDPACMWVTIISLKLYTINTFHLYLSNSCITHIIHMCLYLCAYTNTSLGRKEKMPNTVKCGLTKTFIHQI